jgi:hypothetical protein
MSHILMKLEVGNEASRRGETAKTAVSYRAETLASQGLV